MNSIPVFLACDNNFSKHAGATIASILTNAKCGVDIYILHPGLNADNVKNLKAIVSCYKNSNIVFKSVSEYFKDAQELTKITKVMYYRLLIADLFPNIKKAIYLDCDIIVNSCLSELYNIDISNQYIGAVLSPGGCEEREVINPVTGCRENFQNYLVSLGMRREFTENYYINSGVLLINCSKWRADKLLERAKQILSLGRHLYAPDQDIISVITGHHKKLLPLTWNLQTTLFDAMKKKFLSRWVERHQDYANEVYNFDQTHQLPNVVHYVFSKPWEPLDKKSRYNSMYWFYLSKTPWKFYKFNYFFEYFNSIPRLLFMRFKKLKNKLRGLLFQLYKLTFKK